MPKQVKPEDVVIDRIDELELYQHTPDDIDEIVDWQLDRGERSEFDAHVGQAYVEVIADINVDVLVDLYMKMMECFRAALPGWGIVQDVLASSAEDLPE